MPRGSALPAPESRWVEEVLHLHALWRRGPPRHSNPSFRAANPTAIKKDKKKKKQNQNQKRNENQQQKSSPAGSNAPAASEIEWPCPPAPAPNSGPDGWGDPAGWGDLAPAPAPPRQPPSAEDQAKAAAALAQKCGLWACEEFFSSKKFVSDDDDDDDDDGDDDDDEEEEEEDDSMGEDGNSGSGALRFLLGLFEKDGDLRNYYEKNCEKGEFCCLVCVGIGKKKWRRFPNCVGLVQHCTSISKTKRKEAHRALAKVVCRVLGWDTKRLPSIVLDLSDPLGVSLAKADDLKMVSEHSPHRNPESRQTSTHTPSTRDYSESSDDDIEYPPDIETEVERAQYRQAVLNSRQTQRERMEMERGWIPTQFVHDAGANGSGPGPSAEGYSGASGANDDEITWTSEEEITWTSEDD